MIHTIEAISRLRYVQLDNDYSPEQILHMILAGGVSQPIYNVPEGRFQPAIEFLCTGTRNIEKYPIPGGIVREDAKGRPYFCSGKKSFPANEYLNEFLGTFVAAGIHLKTTRIVTNHGTEGTLLDMAQRAAQTFELSQEEMSWSLMLFSVYPGVLKEWQNEKGETWSVERILEHVLTLPYGEGSCFGTHGLEGISFAVSRYCMERDIEPNHLEGVWGSAFHYVYEAVQLMKRNQKEDGSIDRCWFRKSSLPHNVREIREKVKDAFARRYASARAIVYPTGHCLNAISPLSVFWADDRDWINSACYILAQTIETLWLPLAKEISALSHAIHALKVLGE